MLNTTDVHLLAACLPAWCSYPWTADARRWILPSLFLPRAYACTRACIYVCREVRVCVCVERGRRVVKQVAPKPRPWAVAVKYCGCFKNRSNPSRRYFPSFLTNKARCAYPISREELAGKYRANREKLPSHEKQDIFSR